MVRRSRQGFGGEIDLLGRPYVVQPEIGEGGADAVRHAGEAGLAPRGEVLDHELRVVLGIAADQDLLAVVVQDADVLHAVALEAQDLALDPALGVGLDRDAPGAQIDLVLAVPARVDRLGAASELGLAEDQARELLTARGAQEHALGSGALGLGVLDAELCVVLGLLALRLLDLEPRDAQHGLLDLLEPRRVAAALDQDPAAVALAAQRGGALGVLHEELGDVVDALFEAREENAALLVRSGPRGAPAPHGPAGRDQDHQGGPGEDE